MLLLVGCSSTPSQPDDLPTQQTTSPLAGIALSFQGVPYRYGGATPAGFDCSGLIYYAYQRLGMSFPRDARSQLAATQPLSRTELTSGDLVFFDMGGRESLHVGIYTGGGRFVHAPSTGGKVSVARVDDPYWRARFLRGGRSKMRTK